MTQNWRLGIGLSGIYLIALGSILTGCPIQDAVVVPGSGGAGGGSVSSSSGGASSSSSGQGSSSSGGGQGGAGGMEPECVSHTDCPATNNECILPICLNGKCSTDYVDEGTTISIQMDGDCKKVVCNGVGSTNSVNDDADVPDDMNVCTTESCIDGTPMSGFAMPGDACSAGGTLCDGMGACVACLMTPDCMDINQVCKQNVCVDASCNDLMKNGTETDVDCGGACGASCTAGKMCANPMDCVSGVCMGNTCQAPSCGDMVKNGAETDVDCGGGCPAACADGKACGMAADCASGVCTASVCQVAACNDGVKNGLETGVDCGGMNCAICPTVLLLAGGDVNTIAGEYHPGGMWSVQTFAKTTDKGVGLALTGSGVGVGALRANTGNPVGLIHYTVWNAGAGFGALNMIGASITMKDMPALVGSANQAHLVYWGDNFKYYYGAYSGGIWSPNSEIVGPNMATQSFGNSPAAAAVLGNDLIMAHQGGDGDLYDQRRSAGGWEIAHGHGVNMKSMPAIVSLSSGPDLMIVYNQQSNSELFWTARTNNVFSAPQPINADLSADPVALVALPGGDAMLAFRGLNAKLYLIQWSGMTQSWGNTTQFPADPNALLASSPALAKGVGGSIVELAYLKQGATAGKGLVFHSRLDPMTGWTAPAQVGATEQKSVALAAGP